MNESKSVIELNNEITKELSDPSVVRGLLGTTFKGLDEKTMRQAAFEGALRGFKFKDFLEKNIYAIPFSGSYSLVTSIDYARKRGMRAGIVGKDAPKYVMDGSRIVSCAITVRRFVNGIVGEFTAEVYFDEYNTKRNLWTTKPRTMIAKVAEMHALRMACPEELSQLYTEEEMEGETTFREPMQPYVVARKTFKDDDEAGSVQIDPEVLEKLEESAPVIANVPTRRTDDSVKTRKMEIAALMKEKANFTSLGKSQEKIADKIFDLVGMMYAEENYKAIIEELKTL